MNIQESILNKIVVLCNQYKVRSFYVFGSANGKNFNPNSDLDFVVDFNEKDPILYADLYFQLKQNLEKLFSRPIDLVEDRAIRNENFRAELDETKVLIYGQ